MSKKRVGAAIFTLCAVYLVWPYVTLYRLGDAIRRGDAATLETLVDWDGVREGIKEDICDSVFDEPESHQVASDTHLPPFGFSFVKGIASSAVDSNINPQALVSAARAPEPSGPAPAGGNPRVEWAFFDGPTSFLVLLRPPAAGPGEEPIRVQLDLKHGAWKVTRAWLPREMLTQANPRT